MLQDKDTPPSVPTRFQAAYEEIERLVADHHDEPRLADLMQQARSKYFAIEADVCSEYFLTGKEDEINEQLVYYELANDPVKAERAESMIAEYEALLDQMRKAKERLIRHKRADLENDLEDTMDGPMANEKLCDTFEREQQEGKPAVLDDETSVTQDGYKLREEAVDEWGNPVQPKTIFDDSDEDEEWEEVEEGVG